MALSSGTKLGAYEIQSPLGAGGMGEVYRASDAKLGRDVALKVLPAEMAQDPERLARFRREAKVLAQLDHPNIVTIYSVEESQGVHFLTMQLVEGQPLDRLICAGGLPLEQIVEIASALGDALAAAHEKGIVHRDLKPANVMVSNEGRVKVLDFGLAKDVRSSNLGDATMTSASRTEVGVVMGTPAYMSPEQTSGRPLDHRTDIFSLGVLLHEMATGRRPFEGTSSAELVSSILRDTPASVTDVRPDLPSDLARVVRRCLEKDPRHRLQTARDVSNEFRDMARTASRPMPVSTGTSRMAASSGSGAARVDEGFWVAVLPFKYAGTSTELQGLADGLSDEIVTGLCRFSYLRVIARGSTARYSSESGDIRSIGKGLGARYLMEGNLRQAGTKLRVAVQLVDAVTGAQMWAETYERAFSAENLFEVQDELVLRIVATVADQHGVLPHSISSLIRNKPDDQLSPYEAVLRVFSFHERMSPEEHASVRGLLERVVQNVPSDGDCWAMLATLYTDEYMFGFSGQPDPLGRAQKAAQRAVELAPSSSLAYQALAQSLFFRREWQAFRPVAERTIALNRADGALHAFIGMLIGLAGDWERGCAVADAAIQLNPHHPGWYWLTSVFNSYRKRDYKASAGTALRINMPGYFWGPATSAAALGQLGEHPQHALKELLVIRPDFARTAREEFAKWFDDELAEHYVEGLRKAGLHILENAARLPAKRASDSGATRADEGFWVAVLPFKFAGASAEVKGLADGLSEEIGTGLSRFSYLRVIARGSTAKYSGEAGDVRAIGKDLGARYVMEGSIRQAGAKVRIAVQLIDANAGSSLWAETYDRPFTPEETLDVIDDVVPRIVATVGDAQGVLAHSMTEALRHRDPESLTPYEALLRSFGFHQHVSEDEHLAGMTALESAVKKAPDHADCWAMLSWLYRAEYSHGYHARPESMDRSLTAARRAVNLAPSSQLAHAALASAHFFRGELGEFRAAAERALALNRMQGYTTAFLGLHFAYSGDWERGCALAERATQLNPNHPGWYWLPLVIDAYRQHDGERALQHALKINMPGLWTAQVALTVVNSQLGKMDQARRALGNLLAARPDVATRAQEDLSIWWQPAMVEQMLGDLRKAGLETPEHQKTISSSSGAQAPSIAVLPFANISDNKEQDYFSDGLAEEIINQLAQISGLKVIARTSAFAFRGKEQDVRGIAETLGVSTILQGSVRRAGSRIRVTAQLINAADGSHLWSERYDRELSDIFAVQDEISAAIAKALRVKFSREAVPQRYTPKLEAYEAYLKGRQQQVKVTPASLDLARRYYEQAIALDPAFGMAHIGLAFYWMMLANFDQHSVDESVSAARAEVQRALQIDPSLADGHALLGYLAALFDSDWATAEKHFDFPMAKQASFELVKPMYGGFLYLRENADEAIQLAEHAVEEDPLDVWAHMNLHAYLQAAGREEAALEQLKKVVELDPNQVVALVSMVMIYAAKGDIAEALKIARRAYAIGPWFPDTVGLLAALLRCNGEEEESQSIAKELSSAEGFGAARAHALFHLTCGDIDQGADWVEKALQQRDSSMRFYLGFVICKKLRSSHRWPKIAKMVNLPA